MIEQILHVWREQYYEEIDLQPMIEQYGIGQLLNFLLENVGHLNSNIRENVLVAFYTLAYENSSLSSEELLQVLNVCSSDTHSFNEINQPLTDAAFLRAYSCGFIRWAIYADNKQNFLTDEQYRHYLEKALLYMTLEKDRRGFVYGGKGTIHAPCLGAVMLVAFIENDRFSIDDAPRVLEAIGHQIAIKEESIAFDWANNRLARVITALLKKGVSEQLIKEWIISLFGEMEPGIGLFTDKHYPYVTLGSNIDYFIMCIYFDLKKNNVSEGLREWLVVYQAELPGKVYSTN